MTTTQPKAPLPELNTWPETIYLQHSEDSDVPDFKTVYGSRDEITWCQDKQFDGDVKYIRADLCHVDTAAGVSDDHFRDARNMIIEECAKLISTGDFCRYVDHQQDFCDCGEMAEAIRALKTNTPAPTAQPKQDAVLAEPVAYLDNRYGKDYRGLHFPPKDTWMEGFIPLYTHPPAPPNPADEVFAVYHSEQYVGNFKQALFTTEKKAQAYIDAQTKRLGEEIFIEVMKLDAVIALKTNTPAQEGNQ